MFSVDLRAQTAWLSRSRHGGARTQHLTAQWPKKRDSCTMAEAPDPSLSRRDRLIKKRTSQRRKTLAGILKPSSYASPNNGYSSRHGSLGPAVKRNSPDCVVSDLYDRASSPPPGTKRLSFASNDIEQRRARRSQLHSKSNDTTNSDSNGYSKTWKQSDGTRKATSVSELLRVASSETIDCKRAPSEAPTSTDTTSKKPESPSQQQSTMKRPLSPTSAQVLDQLVGFGKTLGLGTADPSPELSCSETRKKIISAKNADRLVEALQEQSRAEAMERRLQEEQARAEAMESDLLRKVVEDLNLEEDNVPEDAVVKQENAPVSDATVASKAAERTIGLPRPASSKERRSYVIALPVSNTSLARCLADTSSLDDGETDSTHSFLVRQTSADRSSVAPSNSRGRNSSRSSQTGHSSGVDGCSSDGSNREDTKRSRADASVRSRSGAARTRRPPNPAAAARSRLYPTLPAAPTQPQARSAKTHRLERISDPLVVESRPPSGRKPTEKQVSAGNSVVSSDHESSKSVEDAANVSFSDESSRDFVEKFRSDASTCASKDLDLSKAGLGAEPVQVVDIKAAQNEVPQLMDTTGEADTSFEASEASGSLVLSDIETLMFDSDEESTYSGALDTAYETAVSRLYPDRRRRTETDCDDDLNTMSSAFYEDGDNDAQYLDTTVETRMTYETRDTFDDETLETRGRRTTHDTREVYYDTTRPAKRGSRRRGSSHGRRDSSGRRRGSRVVSPGRRDSHGGSPVRRRGSRGHRSKRWMRERAFVEDDVESRLTGLTGLEDNTTFDTTTIGSFEESLFSDAREEVPFTIPCAILESFSDDLQEIPRNVAALNQSAASCPHSEKSGGMCESLPAFCKWC